jgi:hypothetical protein
MERCTLRKPSNWAKLKVMLKLKPQSITINNLAQRQTSEPAPLLHTPPATPRCWEPNSHLSLTEQFVFGQQL